MCKFWPVRLLYLTSLFKKEKEEIVAIAYLFIV